MKVTELLGWAVGVGCFALTAVIPLIMRYVYLAGPWWLRGCTDALILTGILSGLFLVVGGGLIMGHLSQDS